MRRSGRPDREPSNATPSKPRTTDSRAEPVRDENGLIVDEYSDETFAHETGADALDRRASLVSDDRLELAEQTDGIEEIDDAAAEQDGDSEYEGSPRRGIDRITDNILDAHSPDELKERAVGHELPGRAGVTREDVVHGEGLLDSPEDSEPDEDEDEAVRSVRPR